ncbi:MAG: hypothetical protein WKF77_02900 [Planctomycetaceae bacterium]
MTAPEPAFALTDSAPPYWLRILLVTTIAGLLAIVLLFPFPVSARHWGELFNLAHAPSFLLAFLLVAGLFDPSCIGFPKSWQRILPLDTKRLIVLASVLLVLGMTCEVLQGFVERSPSVSDVVANGCGLAAGLFWCLSRQRMARAGRIGLSMVVAGLLSVASWSPILELYDCYLQRQDFPLLASFERPTELHTWFAHEAIISQSTLWSTQGAASMRVQGAAGTKYPGANLQWPVNNWDEFAALEMDVFNPGNKPLTLRISITDKLHAAFGHAATDRYGTSVELPSDKQVHIRIDLVDVQNAPASRRMDMTQIESLNLFVVRPETDFVCMVDNVRLVKD